MIDFEPVLRTPELGPGEKREVMLHGRPVMVANVQQTYYAVDGRCPNEGANLAAEGRLQGFLLICPQDESTFDVRTGERQGPPGGPGLRRYPVKIDGNLIKLAPPESES